MLNRVAALYDAIAAANIDKIFEITNSIDRPDFSSIRKDNSEENILIICGHNPGIVEILLHTYKNEINVHHKEAALEDAAENDHLIDDGSTLTLTANYNKRKREDLSNKNTDTNNHLSKNRKLMTGH